MAFVWLQATHWTTGFKLLLQKHPPKGIFLAFYCWSRCHPTHSGRLCHLFGRNKSDQSPILKQASVFCASPLASMALRFLEESSCVNVCWGCHYKSMVKLAAFCDWLLRKCKSSSWPALPFSLLCWEESLWLLIVQIWLSFTLKAWKIKYLLTAYEIFVHLKNIHGHCDQSWKDTLILWFIWINIYICHIYRFSLEC